MLAREAFKNSLATGSRLLPLMALAVLAGVASTAVAVVDLRTLETQVFALDSAGRSTIVFRPVGDDLTAAIGRESCERLINEPDVRLAGIVIPEERADFLPWAKNAPVNRVSHTLVPALADGPIAFGASVGAPSTTEFFVLHDQSITRGVSAQLLPESTGLNSSVSIPLRPQDASAARCVVVLEHFADSDLAVPRLQAQLSVAGAPITGVLGRADTLDPIDIFLGRADQFLPLTLGALGGIATALLGRFRRSELASYRLSGTSRLALLNLLTLEILYSSGLAGLSAAGTSLIAGPFLRDVAVQLLAAIVLAGSWFVVAVLGSLPALKGSAAELAKDR